MLRLILGEVGSGKTGLLDRMIAGTVAKKIRSYLIVPEQSTVAAERRNGQDRPAAVADIQFDGVRKAGFPVRVLRPEETQLEGQNASRRKRGAVADFAAAQNSVRRAAVRGVSPSVSGGI